MAKIHCKNKEFNGMSASVNFVNGVGVTNDPYLVSWFSESGYEVEEEIREPSDYDNMNYKELTELAKKRGFNGIGVKKEQLILELLKLDEEEEAEEPEPEITTDVKDIETEE